MSFNSVELLMPQYFFAWTIFKISSFIILVDAFMPNFLLAVPTLNFVQRFPFPVFRPSLLSTYAISISSYLSAIFSMISRSFSDVLCALLAGDTLRHLVMPCTLMNKLNF